MSELRVDNIVDMGGSGAPKLRKGANVTGISTITQAVIGNTTINAGGINATGIVTSSSNKFVGDLASGNITAGVMTATSSVVASNITINAGGVNASGIISATSYAGSGANLTGIGLSIAPLIYSPEIGATNQALKPTIELSFNQRIKAGSGNVNLRMVSAGSTIIQSFGVGSSVTINNDGTLPKVSFTPTNDLGLDSVICVDIPAGAFKTMPGTDIAATNWTFTTENVFKYWVAGENSYGQLGLNEAGNPHIGGPSATATSRSSPTQLTSTAWSAINSSHYSSLGRKPAGTLWSWGYQSNVGELGHNEHANTSNKSSPTQIPGTTWSKSVAVGNAVMAATKTDGTLWMWGSGSHGQLGQNTSGTPAHRSSPVQVGSDTTWPTGIDQLSTGYYTHAIKTDGTLWAWGRDWEFGMSGLNFIGNRSSPTQIPGTTWSTVVAGYYVISALKTDGTLWMWGQSGSGSLGDNSRTSRSSPIQVPGTWSSHSTTHMGGGSGAINTDGELFMWGDNSVGTLGQNDVVAQSSPVQVPGTTWSRITQAAENSFVVTKTDGTAWSWGQNEHGMLGLNNTTQYSSPVQIPGTTWQYNLNSGSFSALGKP